MSSAVDTGAVTLIKVNGTSFVAGLYWQTLQNGVSYVAEAKTLGRQYGMLAFAVRKTRLVIQAGYALRGPDQLKGTRSLAAALAHALGNDWIGVFQIDAKTYVLVAVLDGGVMPGRDIVGSFDEIQAILTETIALINSSNGEKSFKRRVAPEAFGLGSESLELATLLRGATIKSAARMRPVIFALPSRKVLMVAFTSTIAVLCVVTGFVFLQKQRATQEAMRLARIEQEKLAARGTQVANIPVRYRAPWEESPAARETASACYNAMNVPLSITGWLLSDETCADGAVSITYTRKQGASLASFRDEARRAFNRDINAADNGNRAILIKDVEMSDGDYTSPMPDFDATVAFASYFQVRDISAQLTEAAELASVDLPNASYQIPWKRYEFTIESSVPPADLIGNLNIGGLRIKTIAMALQDGQPSTLSWTISGELYVLR